MYKVLRATQRVGNCCIYYMCSLVSGCDETIDVDDEMTRPCLDRLIEEGGVKLQLKPSGNRMAIPKTFSKEYP